MAVATLIATGQATLRKGLLRHLGIKPGDKIELETPPDEHIVLVPVRPTAKSGRLLGLLAVKTDRAATTEEVTDATERGWARLVKLDE